MAFGKGKNLDDLYGNDKAGGSPDRRSERNGRITPNREFDLYGSLGGYNNYQTKLYRAIDAYNADRAMSAKSLEIRGLSNRF